MVPVWSSGTTRCCYVLDKKKKRLSALPLLPLSAWYRSTTISLRSRRFVCRCTLVRVFFESVHSGAVCMVRGAFHVSSSSRCTWQQRRLSWIKPVRNPYTAHLSHPVPSVDDDILRAPRSDHDIKGGTFRALVRSVTHALTLTQTRGVDS